MSVSVQSGQHATKPDLQNPIVAVLDGIARALGRLMCSLHSRR